MIGSFGDIVVKNNSGVASWVIRRELAAVTHGYVHNDRVERAALLVTDLAGLDAKLTLAPGKRTGLVDVVVEAKPKAKTSPAAYRRTTGATITPDNIRRRWR